MSKRKVIMFKYIAEETGVGCVFDQCHFKMIFSLDFLLLYLVLFFLLVLDKTLFDSVFQKEPIFCEKSFFSSEIAPFSASSGEATCCNISRNRGTCIIRIHQVYVLCHSHHYKHLQLTHTINNNTKTKRMSGTTTEHAADEAAGEEIFTSDGREPPIVMSPPPVKTTTTPGESDDGKAVLDTTGLSAEQAFEVFAGKIYPISSATRPASSTGKDASGLETPWQRLARLQQEVQELEKDLAPAVQGASTEATVMEAVRELQTRLSSQSNTVSNSVWQERLTQQVADSAASLTRITSVGSMEGQSSTAVPPSPAEGATAADWEARIRKLEKLVGTGANGVNERSHSLLERLAVLEAAAAKLSEKDLEAAMKKAKVIRQDLEAASKARNKLVSSRDANAESSKSIAALHDQMTQLQGLTKLLPVLTQRLQALAVQHSQATTWTQRLAATEQQASQLQTATLKMDASLKQLEESLKTTAEQMMENMKALDAKLS